MPAQAEVDGLYKTGVRSFAPHFKLGTKDTKDLRAQWLFKKALRSLNKELGIFSQYNQYEDYSHIGFHDPETYRLLMKVIQKYPESGSAINAQLVLALHVGFADADREWNVELLKEIEKNYPYKWQGLYAGYEWRLCEFRYERSYRHTGTTQDDYEININDLVEYESKYRKMLSLMHNKSDLRNLDFMEFNDERLALSEYYVSIYCKYLDYGAISEANIYKRKAIEQGKTIHKYICITTR
jgi:hypothetical protein